MPLSFILVCILCQFAMLDALDVYINMLDVHILLSPQEEGMHSSSCGNRCAHLAAHSPKRLKPLSVIILVCLGKTDCFIIGPPIHKDIFACLFSIHNTISLSCHEQVCLSGLRFERYFSHHRET